MEKVVKRALGYGKPKENEDFTHVIFTEDEYSKNTNKIRDLEENIKKLERDYNARIEHYKKSANDKIAEIRTQADGRIAEAQTETNIQKSRADSFENANKNLIRVATERANAKRGLTPKKQRSGYIFLHVEEYTFNCECSIDNSKKAKILKLPCFRIRLQSPYDVTLELEAAKDLIYNDLLNELMDKMDVNSVYRQGFIGYTENEVRKIWSDNESFMFKIACKAFFQKDFWEVEFFARDMITVPPDMILNK